MAKKKHARDDYNAPGRVPTRVGKRTRPTFKKGNPGRPKGSKDKIPRGVKNSIKAILQDIAEHEPERYHRLVRRGLASSPKIAFAYLQLAAHYIDGKPPETLKHEGELKFIEMVKEARGQLTRRLAQLAADIPAASDTQSAE